MEFLVLFRRLTTILVICGTALILLILLTPPMLLVRLTAMLMAGQTSNVSYVCMPVAGLRCER